jgi:hypothetical protein
LSSWQLMGYASYFLSHFNDLIYIYRFSKEKNGKKKYLKLEMKMFRKHRKLLKPTQCIFGLMVSLIESCCDIVMLTKATFWSFDKIIFYRDIIKLIVVPNMHPMNRVIHARLVKWQ